MLQNVIIYRVFKKNVRMFVCWISPKPINRLLNCYFLLKTEIHVWISNTKPILCYFRGLRYLQIKTGLRNIQIHIHILTWGGPDSIRVALRCPDWPLSGQDTPWETSWGNWGTLRASQGMTRAVKSQSGHLKATLVLWGPPQVSMNMYLTIPEPCFVL